MTLVEAAQAIQDEMAAAVRLTELGPDLLVWLRVTAEEPRTLAISWDLGERASEREEVIVSSALGAALVRATMSVDCMTLGLPRGTRFCLKPWR